MAASTRPQTGRCLNSNDIAKLFQPQWENSDDVKPVASYSAANLYTTGNVEVASSSSLTDRESQDNGIPDLDSTAADTETSNDSIVAATTATTVDDDDDDFAASEQSLKRARVNAYYPLAMARRQNRAAQLQYRRRKALPTGSEIETPPVSKGSATVQTDHISPRSTAHSTFTDRWYYPAAMAQQAQGRQAQSMYNRPTTGSRPPGVCQLTSVSSNSPQVAQKGSERNPGNQSHQPESSSTPLIHSQQNKGIHGRFFNRNLQPRPMFTIEEDQLQSPQAPQNRINAADIASAYSDSWLKRKAGLGKHNPLQTDARTRDNWYYSQALSLQSAIPLFSDNWWNIPDEQEPAMGIHEISDSNSSPAGLSMDLPPSHDGHSFAAATNPPRSTEKTRDPGVYGGPFSSQHEPPSLSTGETSYGGVYGGLFDFQMQMLLEHNKLAQEKAIMEK